MAWRYDLFSGALCVEPAGTATRIAGGVEAKGPSDLLSAYPATAEAPFSSIPSSGPYLAAEFSAPAGLSAGKRRTLAETEALIEEQRRRYEESTALAEKTGKLYRI
jgi:hypothetical protein